MQHTVEEQLRKARNISIHAPYKGCNALLKLAANNPSRFQSMHPIKDATVKHRLFCYRGGKFQSMHPIKDATMFSNSI